MGLHLIESSRPRLRMAAWTLWSAGAHGALVGALVARAVLAPEPTEAEGTGREVLYFLPLLPSAPPEPATGRERLRWSGSGGGTGSADGAGSGADVLGAIGAAPRAAAGGSTAGQPTPEPVEVERDESTEGSPIYLETELDQPVERAPDSRGPVYPDSLRAAQVEGAVVAEWVVDTTGRADEGSFRIVSSTHRLFTQAVRECLTGMRFRPAEFNGKLVRQLVRQEFRFRIERPVAVRDSTRG